MTNYSFTVEEGTSPTVSVRSFGLVADMDAKVYFYHSDWVEESGITVETDTNRITITIPGNLATSSNLPSRYKVLVSSDDWETSKTALAGQIFFKRFTPGDPDIDISKGEPGGVAALDEDGDVNNSDGAKVMPVVVVSKGAPTPTGLKQNTVIVELSS